MTATLTPSAICLRAADEIETRGWVQKTATKDGHVCADTALRIAAGVPIRKANESSARYAVYRFLWHTVSSHIGDGVPYWNDTPGRTATEVIDTLRTVATQLAEQGQ